MARPHMQPPERSPRRVLRVLKTTKKKTRTRHPSSLTTMQRCPTCACARRRCSATRQRQCRLRRMLVGDSATTCAAASDALQTLETLRQEPCRRWWRMPAACDATRQWPRATRQAVLAWTECFVSTRLRRFLHRKCSRAPKTRRRCCWFVDITGQTSKQINHVNDESDDSSVQEDKKTSPQALCRC